MNLISLWIIKTIKIQNKEITSDFYPFVKKEHAHQRFERILADLKSEGILRVHSNIDKMDLNIGEKHARVMMASGTSWDIHLHKKSLLYDDFLEDDD